MATYQEITEAQTDKDSPIDTDLMRGTAGVSPTGGVRGNLINHEDRILALESGGGGGGGGGSDTDPRFAQILAGCETNIAEHWEATFSPDQDLVRNQNIKYEDPLGFDPENLNRAVRIRIHEPDSDKTNYFIRTDLTLAYNSVSLSIQPTHVIVFTLPKGINYFSLGHVNASTSSDVVTVTIDGQSMTSFGMLNENNVARTDTFTTVSTANTRQKQDYFWFPSEKKSGKTHEIRITNDATNAGAYFLESVTIGYYTRNPAIDLRTKVESGRAVIQGTETNVTASEVTHVARDGHGRTDAIVSSNTGTLEVVRGISGAATELIAEETYDFTTAVSTLAVKNTTEFSSEPRFMLLQMPNGGKHIFSRTDKTGNLRGTFTNLQWDSQPDFSFIPENNFDSATTADATLSGMVCEWAGGGFEVTSTSRFVDFEITYQGATTSHSAQLNLGLYGIDFVKLTNEFNRACQAVKPIVGEYFLDYNKSGKRWTAGVRATEATTISFLIGTGANTANDMMSDLGFGGSDLTSAVSYVAANQSFTEEQRIYEFTQFRGYFHPTIKYNGGDIGALPAALRDASSYYGMPDFDYFGNSTVVTIHPDPNTCGVILYVPDFNDGTTLMVEVDEDKQRFIYNNESLASSVSARGPMQSIFIPYPRGSRLIRIYPTSGNNFNYNASSADRFAIAGYKQAITRPALEAIIDEKAVIALVDVNPPNYIGTPYAGEYVAGTNDQVDSITKSGGFTTASPGQFYNNVLTFVNTSGQTYDIVFTLANQGGIRIKARQGGDSTKIGFFMGTGAVPTEVSSRISNAYTSTSTIVNGSGLFDSGPLPAGQYFMRFKSEGAGPAVLNEFIIYEEDFAVDRGRLVTLLSGNNNKGVAYTLNHRILPLIRDRRDRVHDALQKSRYQQGLTNQFDYMFDTTTISYQNVNNNANISNDFYFGNYTQSQEVGNFFRMIFHGTNPSMLELCGSTYTTAVEPVLDGSAESTYSTRVQTKGGAAPTGFGLQQELFFTDYKFVGSSDMSSATVLPLADTKGLRANQWGILTADSQPDVRVTVASINPGVSVTFATAIANHTNYTTANNVTFTQVGLHVMQFNSASSAAPWLAVALKYAPLALESSAFDKFRKDNQPDFEQQTELYRGMGNGDKFGRPVFENGELASFNQCTFNIVEHPSTITGWTITDDFTLTLTGTGDVDIQIIATRGNR